jgi:FMN phosphatase YigB (HAD superfamily)
LNWILDFDDTLAVGPNTWALTVILPDIIAANNLTFDQTQFTEATLSAQEIANETNDDQAILDQMFRTLNWPTHLKQDLVTRMYSEYQPRLYDDTLPFLGRLKNEGHTILVISNNSYAPHIAQQLGIEQYFTGIFTPSNCGGVASKPDREMWDYVVAQGLIDTGVPTVVVGDDPWSEGAFADNCGHTCWVLDRLGRYSSLRARYPAYQWAASLDDIPVP